MKSKVILIIFIFMIFNNLQSQNTVISAFLLKWENSKNYLVEIANSMPEEAYSFKPTKREMSFQEQLLHIRENMVWLSETYFMKEGEKSEKIEPKTKEEIITQLTASFNNVSEIIKTISIEDLSTKVEFFSGPKSKLQILNLLQDHVTHHRGQLIVYLNLNNIQPPKYSGW
ncbi:DinB family protein [Lutibacter citreus]|uniref:DinB family protein n=1 Tax=Lutibacter citreus TaxID=2138210 RepID=UPI000DBE3A41|nr:DinB family protein [Lutibacter citreus]